MTRRLLVALAALCFVQLAQAQTTVTANQGAPNSSAYRGWKTQGTDAAGQAPSGMPVLQAGTDGAAVRTVRTDANGNQQVVGPTAAGSAAATAPVLTAGSDGTNVRTLRTNASGQIQIDPWVNGSTAGTSTNPLVVTNRPGYTRTGAPTATVALSTISAAATSLTASSCYRVACNTPCFYRSGSGTPTALTTDNPFYGPAVEKICIPSTDTALAFVTSSGTGSCGLTLLATTP